jgi:branched-chain amino acid transport system ATP-binding protein
VLTLRGVESAYGTTPVLFGVDLDVGEGEVVGLLGRNGMGKTTTVRAIMGLTPARAGEIRFRNHPIAHLPPHRVARCGIGLVPEGRQIFPNLTVGENLAAAARGTGWTEERVHELFPPLRERRHQPGNILSGGEQQMLAIGRALMTNPRLLILDEATEGLAPAVRRDIWQCLRALREAGQSLLVIDSNLAAMTALCDRHYIVEKGRTVWTGTSAALEAGDEVKRRYLGVG